MDPPIKSEDDSLGKLVIVELDSTIHALPSDHTRCVNQRTSSGFAGFLQVLFDLFEPALGVLELDRQTVDDVHQGSVPSHAGIA
jgi:hypothetical protein